MRAQVQALMHGNLTKVPEATRLQRPWLKQVSSHQAKTDTCFRGQIVRENAQGLEMPNARKEHVKDTEMF